MRVGDLVKMKYDMWWKLRSRKDYVHCVGVVLERHHNAVKILLATGDIKCDITDSWKVINADRNTSNC